MLREIDLSAKYNVVISCRYRRSGWLEKVGDVGGFTDIIQV